MKSRSSWVKCKRRRNRKKWIVYHDYNSTKLLHDYDTCYSNNTMKKRLYQLGSSAEAECRRLTHHKAPDGRFDGTIGWWNYDYNTRHWAMV